MFRYCGLSGIIIKKALWFTNSHIIIIIIIKNVLIIVTLHTKVLQGHFTQINAKTLQMLRNNHTIARTVMSLEATGRLEETVHLWHWLVSCSMHVMLMIMCQRCVAYYCCQEGRTALHYAAVGGHIDAVRLLVTAGCDISSRDEVNVRSINFATDFILF